MFSVTVNQFSSTESPTDNLLLLCLFRSCTDVLCCLIFITVILLYVALGIVGEYTHTHTHTHTHTQMLHTWWCLSVWFCFVAVVVAVMMFVYWRIIVYWSVLLMIVSAQIHFLDCKYLINICILQVNILAFLQAAFSYLVIGPIIKHLH